jgi:uncharacterized protein (DUF2252 family)
MAKTAAKAGAHDAAPESTRTPAEGRDAGKKLRDKAPRDAHGGWRTPPKRIDPLDILHAADEARQAQLLPLRYGRMLQSPFTFYRGSAGVMAADLADTPKTGIHVQACGDCHLMNFGVFATAERRIIFDINDFDETLPAPWEWDVKRLAASFALAARSNGLGDDAGRDAATACARRYRQAMGEFAEMNELDVWYARFDDSEIMASLPKDRRKTAEKLLAKATAAHSSELVYPKLVEQAGAAPKIRDNPPTLFHSSEFSLDVQRDMGRKAFANYRESLPDDRRVLLDRYHLVDIAHKVVGIGSVGTHCLVALMVSVTGHPLFLQVKEASASVLEPYAGKSAYGNHGQRVVQGQRLTQPASDLFLGWGTGPRGKDFYVRQLRDVKVSPLVETYDAEMLSVYGRACGWVLARAHAKSGDPWMISGYLGNSAEFDDAMGKFALVYADQAERDHAALKAAVKARKIAVELER